MIALMFKGVRIFCRRSANRGVGGWVSLYFLFTQIEKNVRFNGRPLREKGTNVLGNWEKP